MGQWFIQTKIGHNPPKKKVLQPKFYKWKHQKKKKKIGRIYFFFITPNLNTKKINPQRTFIYKKTAIE